MWGAGGWLSTMAGQVKRNDPIFGWTPAADFAIWRLHPMNSGITALIVHRAGVVKLVDAPDSKSGSARSVGSIPTARTIFWPDFVSDIAIQIEVHPSMEGQGGCI